MEHVKKQEKDSEITEDDLKIAEKKIQEATDAAIKASTNSPRPKTRKSWKFEKNL
jgi:ribosome recycling factor